MMMKILSVSLLVLTTSFSPVLVLAGLEQPTCEYEKTAPLDLTQQRHRSLWFWDNPSCPASSDICRDFWWDIFGWFTRYTLRNDASGVCSTKCTSHIKKYLNDGWACGSESLCKAAVSFDTGGLEEAVVKDDEDDNDSIRHRRVLIDDLVKNLGGNIDGTFDFQENIFVDPDKMDQLVQFIDTSLQETLARGDNRVIKGVSIQNDFQFDIAADTLKTLIGMENIRALYKFYQSYDPGFPVSRITLRRVDFVDTEMHLDWHVDGEGNIVAHVFLNEVFEGGSYTFVTRKGMTKVAADKGTALVHGKNVIHGIESFIGKRYTLLFVGDHRQSKDIVKDLIQQESDIPKTFA